MLVLSIVFENDSSNNVSFKKWTSLVRYFLDVSKLEKDQCMCFKICTMTRNYWILDIKKMNNNNKVWQNGMCWVFEKVNMPSSLIFHCSVNKYQYFLRFSDSDYNQLFEEVMDSYHGRESLWRCDFRWWGWGIEMKLRLCSEQNFIFFHKNIVLFQKCCVVLSLKDV